MSVQNPPAGYHTATPYLIVDGAAAAIEFYERAFGAEELFRFEAGGKIAHAEIRIGTSPIMLSDGMGGMGYKDPKALGASTVGLMLYVDDVDAAFERAVAAGAEPVMAVEDQFYGDRSGNLADPFGHLWTIATHKEDVPPEEMKRRFDAMAAEMAGKQG
jgi:PhnB protein